MENNKITISLTTAIIIAVIIGALILGIVSLAIYHTMDKNNNPILKETQNTQQDLSSSNSNKPADNSSSNINNNSEDTSTTTNNNSSSTQQDSSSSQAGSITGKSSSKSNPLSINEWGLASKHSTKGYIDIPVKVTNVTRGSAAAQKVKDYCNNGHSFYKYEDAKKTMEWAVIDYTVDLTNIEAYASGEKSIAVDTTITGTGKYTSIIYNDITYIVSTMNMTTGFTKENIVNAQFAVQLPIGCTDYLIALGSSQQTQAFFMGK